MSEIKIVDNEVFTLDKPENYSGLYLPVANEKGLKSSVTPNFGGDAKLNQNAFLLEPVSEINLHNNRSVRNIWVNVDGKGVWSAVGASAEEENKKFTEDQDKSSITAGFMWQTVTRESTKYGLEAVVTDFSPVESDVEIMHVKLTNKSGSVQMITPTAAIPVYGRSADNIRDHRHVTAMLQRISTFKNGVVVKPTLSFDERGHKKNDLSYFVCGVSGKGEAPKDFYPLVDTFIGEGGTLTRPYVVVKNIPGVPAGSTAEGKEAMGAFRFETCTLLPGESAEYTIVMGITADAEVPAKVISLYDSTAKVQKALEELKSYWNEKVNVSCSTGNKSMDSLMKWVSFQPFLRRIYGCSFLPHHDYGRGGRGWRDLWQDCLSLLIMDPKDVRSMIVNNYGGVRIDGTNATIIGSKPGEFIADRNGIARVWMDHGVWPFITTLLYINQTGDVDVLKEKVPYFKDEQCMRGTELDKEWTSDYGVKQKISDGKIYEGTIFEHILLENLCAFYEVGEHNHMRLRGADWNDALDMAAVRGESVAFTAAFAGNLKQIADLLLTLKNEYGWKNVTLLDSIKILISDNTDYDNVSAKKFKLVEYLSACRHNVSGKTVDVSIDELASDLNKKSEWIMDHIRKTEWISGKDEGWFNSYYDNDGQAVEGYNDLGVRMMLTGQVFTIMSGTALEDQVKDICKSADKYLYKKEIGGYRLNTNFHEEKYNMGRMFGFAYGEKENGAVFSHMAVMYANALYQRGFAKEGHKALNTLAQTALNFETSRIYPGIPEYFDANGRGLYHYLTGAASWFLLTYVTEVYGVKGEYGKLTVSPKLMAEQFDSDGNSSIRLSFAGKKFQVTVKNPQKKDFGEYKVVSASCDGKNLFTVENGIAKMDMATLDSLDKNKLHTVEVKVE